jgi:hypothetical protein
MSSAATRFSLVYRGNAIDGWISAFIASTALRSQGEFSFFPICANQSVNAKQLESWKGSHVLLLDLSLGPEERQKMLDAGILSVDCRDHHETSLAHWPADSGKIDTSVCTSIAIWNHWYSHQEKPFWLHSVDRISRWDQPTLEDRVMREVLMVLSRLPPHDALGPTQAFMTWAGNPFGPEFSSLMIQGRDKLIQKDHELLHILQSLGRFYTLTEQDIMTWGLSPEWNGVRCFIVDNTDVVIDTNEAAFLTFLHNAEVQVFINYRKKPRRDSVTGKLEMNYLYSARSRHTTDPMSHPSPVDLTSGGFFKGHPSSAGSSVPLTDHGMYPFVPLSA